MKGVGRGGLAAAITRARKHSHELVRSSDAYRHFDCVETKRLIRYQSEIFSALLDDSGEILGAKIEPACKRLSMLTTDFVYAPEEAAQLLLRLN